MMGVDGVGEEKRDRNSKRFRVVLRLCASEHTELLTAPALSRASIRVLGLNRVIADPGRGHRPHVLDFDGVCNEDASPRDVYESTAKPLVECVLQGFNGCVISYAALNCTEPSFIQKNIISRAAEDIFTSPEVCHCKIRVSSYHISNEKIYDLLESQVCEVSRIHDSEEAVILEGLREVEVSSAQELLQAQRFGIGHRNAGILKGDFSSQSHTVFNIMVIDMRVQSCNGGVVTASKLTLAELASSSNPTYPSSASLDVRKSLHLAPENLQEAKTLKRSLTIFRNVIFSLSTAGCQHVPYRESKLTRALRDCLGGNCRTCLLVSVPSNSTSVTETTSCLQFAARAMSVSPRAIHISKIRYTPAQVLSSWKTERGRSHTLPPVSGAERRSQPCRLPLLLSAGPQPPPKPQGRAEVPEVLENRPFLPHLDRAALAEPAGADGGKKTGGKELKDGRLARPHSRCPPTDRLSSSSSSSSFTPSSAPPPPTLLLPDCPNCRQERKIREEYDKFIVQVKRDRDSLSRRVEELEMELKKRGEEERGSGRVEMEDGRVKRQSGGAEDENRQVEGWERRVEREEQKVEKENGRVEREDERVEREDGRVERKDRRVEVEVEDGRMEEEDRRVKLVGRESRKVERENRIMQRENGQVEGEDRRMEREDGRVERKDRRVEDGRVEEEDRRVKLVGRESRKVEREDGRLERKDRRVEDGRVEEEDRRVKLVGRESRKVEREDGRAEREDGKAEREDRRVEQVDRESRKVEIENGRMERVGDRVEGVDGREESENGRMEKKDGRVEQVDGVVKTEEGLKGYQVRGERKSEHELEDLKSGDVKKARGNKKQKGRNRNEEKRRRGGESDRKGKGEEEEEEEEEEDDSLQMESACTPHRAMEFQEELLSELRSVQLECKDLKERAALSITQRQNEKAELLSRIEDAKSCFEKVRLENTELKSRLETLQKEVSATHCCVRREKTDTHSSHTHTDTHSSCSHTDTHSAYTHTVTTNTEMLVMSHCVSQHCTTNIPQGCKCCFGFSEPRESEATTHTCHCQHTEHKPSLYKQLRREHGLLLDVMCVLYRREWFLQDAMPYVRRTLRKCGLTLDHLD